jgi:hypothetical protein
MDKIKNLGHLMLDLETMGKRPGCAIVSIGAVEFDIKTGATGREFYERVNLKQGLFVDASTIYWWLQQNEQARLELCKGGLDIDTALAKFGSFTLDLGDFEIWGNGASFDFGILEAAIYACGYTKEPWDFRKERDVRTMVSLAPVIKEHYSFSGVQHYPIDDCKHQIGYCSAIWRYIIQPFME